MQLYDDLVQRKRNGQPLDMTQVTPAILHQLWWQEDRTDGEIAELFEVTKKKITNLRHKWDIKEPETIVKEFINRFKGNIPTSEDDAQLKSVSADAAHLLRKIQRLNDIELESLRLELNRHFPAFSEIKKETEFLAAVERAVRQFGVKID